MRSGTSIHLSYKDAGRKGGMEGGREEGCVHIKNVDEDGGVVRMRVGRLVCLKEEMRWRREAALAGAQWQRSLQRGGREKARGRVLNLPVKRDVYVLLPRVPIPSPSLWIIATKVMTRMKMKMTTMTASL